MIPKKIHYCWFGGKPLPETAIKCIESWKQYLPDYEIVEWNENNFDVTICDYIKEAFQLKKWAFVSDYARFWILYNHGGLYFDTDVELIKPLDDIVCKGAFVGTEWATMEGALSGKYLVNPGVALGSESRFVFFGLLLEKYADRHYIDENGMEDKTTICEFVTELLKQKGLSCDGSIEVVEQLFIYPPQYFCPMNYCTGKMELAAETHSIHWYAETWLSTRDKRLSRIVRWASRFGKCSHVMERIVSFPFRVERKIYTLVQRKRTQCKRGK